MTVLTTARKAPATPAWPTVARPRRRTPGRSAIRNRPAPRRRRPPSRSTAASERADVRLSAEARALRQTCPLQLGW